LDAPSGCANGAPLPPSSNPGMPKPHSTSSPLWRASLGTFMR